MASSELLARARKAIGGFESGDRYGITGPATGNDVPLGRYQVMRSNLPAWSQAALGRSVSEREFLATPALQDAVFNHRFGGYLDKHGLEGAAQAWFGGEGSIGKNGRRDILGTSVGKYGKEFLRRMGAVSGGAPAGDGWEPVPGAQTQTASADGWEPVEQGSADSSAEPVPDTQPDAAPAAQPPQTLADGPSLEGLASNAKGDFENIKTGLGNLIKDPVSTLKAGAAGLWQDLTDPVNVVKRFTMAANPGQYLLQHGKQDVDQAYQKPVSTALNAAGMAIPGGVGRAALKTTTALAAGADKVGAATLGKALTGVSGPLQREALAAGEAGGSVGQAFRGQLTGKAPKDEVIRLANEAEDAIHNRGLADRNATLAGGSGQTVAANTPGRLNNALAAARAGNRDVAGIIQSQGVEDLLNALKGHIDEAFPGGVPRNPSVLSVEGMDALKRRMGDTLSEHGATEGGTAGRLGGQVYNAVKSAITDAYPEYAPGMERAQASIENLQQLQRQLALNSKNNATKAGKLQQAARDDAHGAYGMRKDALKQLGAERPELPAALAGQALGTMSPRGIAPWMMMGVHGAHSLPTALVHYIASIPRLHGEARYALGSTIRGARAAGLTQRNLGAMADIARILSTQDNGPS
jgi:hypothetical protein